MRSSTRPTAPTRTIPRRRPPRCLNQDIRVIGLKAFGAGTELDTLATNTGGSVQALSSDGANIGAAIVAGLEQPRHRRRDGDGLQPTRSASSSIRPARPSRPVTTRSSPRRSASRWTRRRARRSNATTGRRSTAMPMTDANGDVILEHKIIHIPDVTAPDGAVRRGPEPARQEDPARRQHTRPVRRAARTRTASTSCSRSTTSTRTRRSSSATRRARSSPARSRTATS